jgi:hypothetical protein
MNFSEIPTTDPQLPTELEGAEGLNIQSSVDNEDKVSFNEWIDNIRKLRNESTTKKYIHSVTHIHPFPFGEDHYVFYSYQQDHYGEDDFQDKIIELLEIEFYKDSEEIRYSFNIEAPTYK